MAERVCPVWVGYLLSSPLRRLFQNPEKIFKPYITEGMTVLDVGCAMGFFSLPLAQMVGAGGKVICVDMQEKMLTSLRARGLKKSISDRIETRLCKQNSLCLEEDLRGKVDFAFASAVAHEVPDENSFFSEIYAALRARGNFLVIEPKGHVAEKKFAMTVSAAKQNGFREINRPRISRSRSVLLVKVVRLKPNGSTY